MRTIKLKCPQCKQNFDVPHWRAKLRKCCSFKCSQTLKSRQSAKARGDKMRGRGKGYIRLNGRYLHTQLAEIKLGRKLRKNEVTHHKNENKRDNRIKNIDVMTRAQHMNFHRKAILAARKKKLGY